MSLASVNGTSLISSPLRTSTGTGESMTERAFPREPVIMTFSCTDVSSGASGSAWATPPVTITPRTADETAHFKYDLNCTFTSLSAAEPTMRFQLPPVVEHTSAFPPGLHTQGN